MNNIKPAYWDGEKLLYYPEAGFENYEVTKSGTYDIYFRPDGQGNHDWWQGTLYLAESKT